MTYFLETYGCQMNKAESSALERIMLDRGWGAAPDSLSSDLVLVNTCSVRITAETRVYGRLAHLVSEKRTLERQGRKSFTLAVTGCMAERLKESLKSEIKGVDYVIGNFQKTAFGLMLDACERGLPPVELVETPRYVFSAHHAEKGAFQAFVPIMHGCDNFCSYCIVPYVRGREVSRSPDEVIAEILDLERSGAREITLLGQNVNSYRFDDGVSRLDFPGLLRRIALAARERGSGGVRWVRFLTSHPKDLSDDLVRVLAEERLFARHVHLCAQHGSDSVLARMNRKYTVSEYLAIVEKLRKAIPDVSLSTDILVGFPGETEEDFGETLRLMESVRFSNAFMYHFNPREGTKAFTMDCQIPEPVRLERLERLIALQRGIGASVLRERVGSTCEVLVDAVSKRRDDEVHAHTEREEMVVFKGDRSLIGTFAKVRLVSLKGGTFRAEIVP